MKKFLELYVFNIVVLTVAVHLITTIGKNAIYSLENAITNRIVKAMFAHYRNRHHEIDPNAKNPKVCEVDECKIIPS